MPVKKIKVSNFKVFDNLEIELNDFNVLIGANASGKSSFIEIFNFLRNIIESGLENAISLEGGVEYLKNIKLENEIPVSLEIVIEPFFNREQKFKDNGDILYRRLTEIKYSFSLLLSDELDDSQYNYRIIKDNLEINFIYYNRNSNGSKTSRGEVKIQLEIKDECPEIKIEENDLNIPEDLKLTGDKILPVFFREMKLSRHKLILETPLAEIIEPSLRDFIKGISIYDINPGLPKKAAPVTGKSELEENASNLSLVLKNILDNKNKRRQFTNILKDILPFVEEIDVEKYPDRSLLLKLRETYNKNNFIPASLISDGTINITALIVALYFEEDNLAIIEEPERNIHPHLISKMVEMVSDASRKKQIIITTHNPEMIKYIDLEHLYLIHRAKNGFSFITKPAEKEEIKVFLNNDMGIDELYIQNLLEV
ncbi:MAG: AAA family ATPase [Halanaerobiaceae bacterium]